MNKIILLLVSVFFSLFAKAQESTMNQPQMAEGLRADGKIYVVIAVIAIIFISLITYLIYIDLKLRRLEKK